MVLKPVFDLFGYRFALAGFESNRWYLSHTVAIPRAYPIANRVNGRFVRERLAKALGWELPRVFIARVECIGARVKQEGHEASVG
jgi:hypothetical protein